MKISRLEGLTFTLVCSTVVLLVLAIYLTVTRPPEPTPIARALDGPCERIGRDDRVTLVSPVGENDWLIVFAAGERDTLGRPPGHVIGKLASDAYPGSDKFYETAREVLDKGIEIVLVSDYQGKELTTTVTPVLREGSGGLVGFCTSLTPGEDKSETTRIVDVAPPFTTAPNR